MSLTAAPNIGIGKPIYQGELSQVPISLSHDDGLVATQFDLNYDPSLVTPGQPSSQTLSASGHELRAAIIAPGRQRILIVPPQHNPVLPSHINLSLSFTSLSTTEGSSQLLLDNIILSSSAQAGIPPATVQQGLLILGDTTPPVLTLPPNLNIEANAILSQIDLGIATAIDDRDGPVATSNNAPTGFALGITDVTWHASDSRGNTAEGIQSVTVVDTTAPQLSAPASILQEATAPHTQVELGQASASDIFPFTLQHDAPSQGFAVGEHIVTWSATDENQNSSSAEQHITITDTTPPTVTTPDNITAEANAVLSSIDIGIASAIDLVDGEVAVTHDAPPSYPLGDTVITYQAQDSRANLAQAQQTVTVQDTTAPTIQAPAAIIMEASAALTPVTLGNAIADDIFPVTINHNAPIDGFSVGNHNVQWTATDSSQNSSHATQHITITDTTPPLLTIPEDLIAEANAILSTIDIGTASAIDLVDSEVAVIHNAPPTYPLGNTIVTYSTQDTRNNHTRAQQTITVQDTTPPLLTPPADINVIATGPTTHIDIGKASADDIFATEISHNAPSAFPVGNTVVTWTAVDANNNQSQAQQTITASYQFGGWLPPLNEKTTHKAGRTIPVKFQLFYAGGNVVKDAQPKISLINDQGLTVKSGTMRLTGQQYLYNLDTKQLEAGNYALSVELNDGVAAKQLGVVLK